MRVPIIWNTLSAQEKLNLLKRPVQKNISVRKKTETILNAVKKEGDKACQKFTQQFDGVLIKQFTINDREFKKACQKISRAAEQAIQCAARQIMAFHKQQKLQNYTIATSSGIVCEMRALPIEKVGLYVPGGSAPLVSTVLMLGIPANIANCPLPILCSPPRADGSIDPHILIAAKYCGIKNIYKIGGAQAIAAMAYGTKIIPKVDKIFGPGNAWVTQAKMLVAQDVAGAFYDLPAGPSELMIIADAKANAEFIAADLLSQAEHGTDSQVILLTTNVKKANEVLIALKQQLSLLTRYSIAKKSLENSRIIVVNTIQQAIELANTYAPEHLILQIVGAKKYLQQIKNAGSIFLGSWSPESAGDYASGTNHILPTYGFAKTLSGLTVRDFMKTISVQKLTKNGLQKISSSIIKLAEIEGLDAHARAVKIRLEVKK